MTSAITELLAARHGDNFALHERHLNATMVRMLRTIGYDRDYVRALGPHLFDAEGARYLDLLSGFGVFALGRNHPHVVATLRDVLAAELPDLVQMDVSLLSGLLAERLLATCPGGLARVFFCNSGAEAVEAAIKFARAFTGRARVLYCDHGYHGLTMGALSLTAEPMFRDGFGPLLPGCAAVPFNDLAALERELASGDVAGFIVEPIQGKGVNLPDDAYLAEAARLCRRHGTLLIADEVQTGLGRTGRMWAVEHWGVGPDMLLTAKALSGGFVPVGAVMMREEVMDRVFNRLDRAVVHGSTFGKNNLAMAAGLATLEVIETEGLVARADRMGADILAGLSALVEKYEFLHAVRGRGLMIALEFGPPRSLKLRAAWSMLEAANKGLFCQMVTIPLLRDHRVLTQVAGHGLNVIKLLPPLVIDAADRDWLVGAFDRVIADCHRVPGAVWDLGRTLAGQAMRARRAS